MGTVQKKFSKQRRKRLSKEEQFDKDLKECMKCKFFWGNDNRCIRKKCYKEEKKPVAVKEASLCDECPYNNGNGYCFPCMRKILGK